MERTRGVHSGVSASAPPLRAHASTNSASCTRCAAQKRFPSHPPRRPRTHSQWPVLLSVPRPSPHVTTTASPPMEPAHVGPKEPVLHLHVHVTGSTTPRWLQFCRPACGHTGAARVHRCAYVSMACPLSSTSASRHPSLHAQRAAPKSQYPFTQNACAALSLRNAHAGE